MEILFLLVGLLFVAFGLLALAAEVRTRRGACEVQGEVVGFSTTEGGASDGRYFHPVAQYVSLDGATRYIEGSVGSSSPLGSVGDAVTVLIQPDDPQTAAIQSSLTYVLGVAIVLMGLASCIIFFAIFRISSLSVAGAVVVVSCGAWKLHGMIRDKPLSLAAWRDYKARVLRARTFTDATKGQIPWADPAALEKAVANQKAANRLAIPFFLLAGVGLVLLGGHLRKQTESFLERAVPAAGVVVDMVANHSGDTTTYAPVVVFEHDGQTYRFKDSVGSNPPSHRMGEAVRVLYDPARPGDARIDRGRWNKVIPILVAICGGLFCALGIWLAWRRV
jgi:uncharacterized protein DUF3592